MDLGNKDMIYPKIRWSKIERAFLKGIPSYIEVTDVSGPKP